MYKTFLKYCKLYRIIIDKLFSLNGVYRLSIPMGIYGNFDNHYLVYDKDGNVIDGTQYLYQALKKRNDGEFGISVLYDKY